MGIVSDEKRLNNVERADPLPLDSNFPHSKSTRYCSTYLGYTQAPISAPWLRTSKGSVPVMARHARNRASRQVQATTQGRDLSTFAPLRALRARAPVPAWARRVVGEGVLVLLFGLRISYAPRGRARFWLAHRQGLHR
jgi:hypothetical protein